MTFPMVLLLVLVPRQTLDHDLNTQTMNDATLLLLLLLLLLLVVVVVLLLLLLQKLLLVLPSTSQVGRPCSVLRRGGDFG